MILPLQFGHLGLRMREVFCVMHHPSVTESIRCKLFRTQTYLDFTVRNASPDKLKPYCAPIRRKKTLVSNPKVDFCINFCTFKCFSINVMKKLVTLVLS